MNLEEWIIIGQSKVLSKDKARFEYLVRNRKRPYATQTGVLHKVFNSYLIWVR